MYNLTDYLKKFKVLVGDKSAEKKRIRSIILESCGISVPLDNITLTEGAVRLKLNPIEKLEVQLKRTAILAEFSNQNLFITQIS